MGSEQDRGWTIETECHYDYRRGGASSFYESQATHPIYGETIPARSIDEQTAYQETLTRIARIESQISSSPEMPMMEMVEFEAEAATEAEAGQPNPNVEIDMESERGIDPDPLAAEFSLNVKPINPTRRIENGLANHRIEPRRRPAPKGRITFK